MKRKEVENPTDWIKPSKPEEIRPVPWLHELAIGFLESLLKPRMRVFEHGSGGSTLWFAERVAGVFSVENKPEWYMAVAARLPERKDVALELWQGAGAPHVSGRFDLALIDGDPVENRRHYINLARSIVKPGGWIVLDNCNRPEYEAERRALQENCEVCVLFTSKQTRYGNTEFYRLRK